jgi:hypothetical protein
LPDRAATAAEERTAAELGRLHGQAAEQLRLILSILERQADAVRTGSARSVNELAALESSATGTTVAIERAIVELERSAVAGNLASRRHELDRLREEHERLRSAVLERNRATRTLIEAELRANRRELVAHRARMGTPSPYSSIGEARLLDIRR